MKTALRESIGISKQRGFRLRCFLSARQPYQPIVSSKQPFDRETTQ